MRRGVSGVSFTSTPISNKASFTALMMAAGGGIAPPTLTYRNVATKLTPRTFHVLGREDSNLEMLLRKSPFAMSRGFRLISERYGDQRLFACPLQKL